MRFPFLFILISLFLFGCLQQQTISGEFNPSGKTVSEISASHLPFVCEVKLNDEIGEYQGRLNIEKENYMFEFRLKNVSSEIRKINEKYYEKINESWLMFSNNSFKLAEQLGAVEPSFILKIPVGNLVCVNANFTVWAPSNYTDFDKILYGMKANETKGMEALKINCDLFTFYNCSEFEKGELKKACDYCKEE